MSERGITLLLNFLRDILWCLSTYSAELLQLLELIPKNVYFLKKMCSSEKGLHTYVVCPKCYTLYNLEECIIRQRNCTVESAKCSFVQYPNHPHVSCREKCNAILMKRTKHGSSYKLIPCKVYTYNNLKASLTKFFGKPGFSYKC